MNEIPLYPAEILLPKAVDFTKWAVIACDQFTSQPDYWQAVEDTVGSAPSTLRLILPEAKLNAPDVEESIREINASMNRYLELGLFQTLPSAFVYVERTQSDGSVRHGLIGMIDLEQYDFTPGSGALIRATEGTVLERIPPRVRVRRDAVLELPHVMLLMDDPKGTVIEPLTAAAGEMDVLYEFPLQQGGGHLKGRKLTSTQTDAVTQALSALCSPLEIQEKYGLGSAAPLLFAVGDGNHSLATAKQCYEDLKAAGKADTPARYALVEVVNIHDAALRFEPIHRVLFGVEPREVLDALKAFYPGTYEGQGPGHTIAYTWSGGKGVLTIPQPKTQLAVGTLQAFLDGYLAAHPGTIDYIHGEEAADALGAQPGGLAFKVPGIQKSQLFQTVMTDGVLPRKTFSMGHAQDKRYYVEARKIQ